MDANISVDCLLLTEILTELKTKLENGGNKDKFIVKSTFSDCSDSSSYILGIDEAGRGPVLGPMVYGACYCNKEKVSLLTELGCADSKSLTEQKREEIFKLMCKEADSLGWLVDIISPNRISNLMQKRNKCSLNEISHNSAINLIHLSQESGVNVTEVYIDTVGPPEKYQDKLSKMFPNLKITVSKKADSLYPVVSAASICAKVIRDLALKSWKFSEEVRINADDGWGSGYPNDPVTKEFLTNNVHRVFGFPQIVRFSWSTAKTILTDKAASVQWSDEEEDLTPANQSTISSFFNKPQYEMPKHTFFQERLLKSAEFL